SVSFSNWNWNKPLPKSEPTGLLSDFQSSVKKGMRDQTF
ncbi:unnamed protein product, partial [Brassica oleracea]